jgi:hypothetical protein
LINNEKSGEKKNTIKKFQGGTEHPFWNNLLNIFASMKLKDMQLVAKEGETSTTLNVLMNPLESSFESSKKIVIIMPGRSRISSFCKNESFFGKQLLQTSQLSYGVWKESELNISIENKYIFSENPIEGKKIYVFSKPFEFPFKFGDLIYLSSSEDFYCFINPPPEVEDEIEKINQANLLIENCPQNSIRVCFKNQANCNIKVSYSSTTNSGYVTKGTKRMYFPNDALMYAAIFSDSGNYECQVQRLMKRGAILNGLYQEKNTRMMRELQCGAEISPNLIIFGNLLENFKESSDFNLLRSYADDLGRQNTLNWGCALW